MNSLSKNRLKALASFRHTEVCRENGVFVVEGTKMCDEALLSGFRVVAICAVEQWWQQRVSLRLSDDCECYVVAKEDLQRLSLMVTPNMVWMLVERHQTELSTMPTVTIALDKVQDPGNMGTIMRTADWFGLRHIVCSRDTVSCYNPKVVQSTMGAVFRTKVDYVDLAEWLRQMNRQGTPVYGASLDGENVYRAALEVPAVIVIGNESRGLSDEVESCLTRRVTIPNVGGTCESLNAASATAILCAEFISRTYCPEKDK